MTDSGAAVRAKEQEANAAVPDKRAAPSPRRALIVPPEPERIAEALVRMLRDRGELERLASGARAAGERWLVSPEEYAQRVRELVER